MINYDLLNQDKVLEKIVCPDCEGTGWVGDNGPGLKGNTEVAPCDCGQVKPMLGDESLRKVSDLTIAELYDLIPKIVRECKRQDDEKAEVEYQKLTVGKVPNTI